MIYYLVHLWGQLSKVPGEHQANPKKSTRTSAVPSVFISHQKIGTNLALTQSRTQCPSNRQETNLKTAPKQDTQGGKGTNCVLHIRIRDLSLTSRVSPPWRDQAPAVAYEALSTSATRLPTSSSTGSRPELKLFLLQLQLQSITTSANSISKPSRCVFFTLPR